MGAESLFEICFSGLVEVRNCFFCRKQITIILSSRCNSFQKSPLLETITSHDITHLIFRIFYQPYGILWLSQKQTVMKASKGNTRKKVNSLSNDIRSFTSNSEARAYLETYFKEITPSDELEIMECLKKSAKEGDAMCQHMLGFCLSVGYGCDENPREAIKWWTKAAEQGDICAQRCLGSIYYYGKSNVRKNYKKAACWLEKAALQNDDYSSWLLGECYRFGQGVEKNLETAVFWFAKAAELGYIIAHYSLAVCYHNGEGVAQDRDKAFEHFKVAAEGGDSDAQYRLASYYLKGWGVPEDSMKAWEWFVKAAKQDNEDALRFVNKVLNSINKE